MPLYGLNMKEIDTVHTSCCRLVITVHVYTELGDPSSILGRTTTYGLKIIEEKVLP